MLTYLPRPRQTDYRIWGTALSVISGLGGARNSGEHMLKRSKILFYHYLSLLSQAHLLFSEWPFGIWSKF